MTSFIPVTDGIDDDADDIFAAMLAEANEDDRVQKENGHPNASSMPVQATPVPNPSIAKYDIRQRQRTNWSEAPQNAVSSSPHTVRSPATDRQYHAEKVVGVTEKRPLSATVGECSRQARSNHFPRPPAPAASSLRKHDSLSKTGKIYQACPVSPPSTQTVCQALARPLSALDETADCARKNTSAVSRRFPGPAGLLPPLGPDRTLEEAVQLLESGTDYQSTKDNWKRPRKAHELSNDIENNIDPLKHKKYISGPWRRMLVCLGLEEAFSNVIEGRPGATLRNTPLAYNISFLQHKASSLKVPALAVHVKSLASGDNSCTILEDYSGEIPGEIHRRVLEDFDGCISAGCVLVLVKVSVFSPRRRRCYLNITLDNIAYIFREETKHTAHENDLPLIITGPALTILKEEMPGHFDALLTTKHPSPVSATTYGKGPLLERNKESQSSNTQSPLTAGSAVPSPTGCNTIAKNPVLISQPIGVQNVADSAPTYQPSSPQNISNKKHNSSGEGVVTAETACPGSMSANTINNNAPLEEPDDEYFASLDMDEIFAEFNVAK